MMEKVRVLLFGEHSECRMAENTIRQAAPFREVHVEAICVDDLEELSKALVDWEPTLLVVTADGAEGMESVYRSREQRPSVPVFWFSDDKDFGVLSYRLNCAYFSVKPVTEEKLNHAIQRCDHLGICCTT